MFWKSPTATKNAAQPRLVRRVEPSVSKALIMICEKCGQKLESRHRESPARELKTQLKKTIREAFPRGEVRAVMTGCLDLCPRDLLGVMVARTQAAEPYYLEADPDRIPQVVGEILKCVKAQE